MKRYKKYPNRRLYDLEQSKYVTVDDVRRTIVAGESIQVVDARDDSDITRSVLLQILSEQEAEGHNAILTDRVIEQIIRFYGDMFGGVAAQFIEQSILGFLKHQETYRSQLRKLHDSNPFSLMRETLERGAEAWQQAQPKAEQAESKSEKDATD